MFSAESVYILMFTSGILGGFGHCLGMCGPVVACCSFGVNDNRLAPHILYNLGRISTYTLLGGLTGMTGSFIGIAGHMQGLQRSVMTAAGVLIILMGLGLAGWLPRMRFFQGRETLVPRFLRWIGKLSLEKMSTGSFYPTGIFLGFIPCGLVYTALLTSARAGMEAENHFWGFLDGLSLMFLFGLGTVPSLVLFGKIMNSVGATIRARLYRLSAAVMILMGIIFIVRAT